LARLLDFRRADTLGSIQDLALQVGEVDRVRIGKRQLAEATGCEIERSRAAQAAGADDQRARPP
jgi:hypothetical protein